MNKSLRKKTLTGFLWIIVQNITRNGITLVVFTILARLLDPVDIGLVAMAMLFVVIGGEISKMGLATAIVQKPDLDDEHINSAFWGVISLSLFFYICLLLTAPLVERLLNTEGLAKVLFWIGVILVINATGKIPEAILRRSLNFKSVALRTIFGSFFGGIIGVTLAFTGAGVWSIVAKQLTDAIVSAVTVWKAAGWTPRFRFSCRHLKQLLSFGINDLFSSMLLMLNQNMDRLIISVFWGPILLGQYVIGKRIVLMIQRLSTQTLSNVMFPAFSKIQNNPERFYNAFVRINRIIIFISCPILGLLVFAGDQITVFVFGEKWQEASELVRIFGGMGCFQAFSFLVQPALNARNFPNLSARLGLYRVVFDAVFICLFFPMGIMGIAYALLVRSALMIPVALLVSKKVFLPDLSRYFKDLKYLIISIFLFFSTSFLVTSSYLKLDWGRLSILKLSFPIAIYFVSVWFMDKSFAGDVKELWRDLYHKKSKKALGH